MSELDAYSRNKIEWKRRDIAKRLEETGLARVLEYELFLLEQKFAEAVAQGSKNLAGDALDYAQHVEVLLERYARPKR